MSTVHNSTVKYVVFGRDIRHYNWNFKTDMANCISTRHWVAYNKQYNEECAYWCFSEFHTYMELS